MKSKSVFILCGLLLSASVLAQTAGSQINANLSTQNTSATSTCSDSSACVEIPVANLGSATISVTGVYTGALSLQRTVGSRIWETVTATSSFTDKAGTQTATIASAATGTYVISNITGFSKFRITPLSAFTGVAVVAVQTGSAGGNSSGSSGGGAVTIADGANITQGTTTDAACATDNGTCTTEALIKRTNQNLTTLNTSINTANAQLPAALGATTAANSLSVVQATDATPTVVQGSTTSGQKGNLIQGAVTTSAPTYTTGQTSPLSIDTLGNLRTVVQTSATANADANRLPVSLNIASPVTGTSASAAVLSNFPVAVGLGAGTIVVEVTAISGGAVCNFEYSTDGAATYTALSGWLSTNQGSSGTVASASATGKFILPVLGTHFRLRQSNTGSVTATVTFLTPSTQTTPVFVNVAGTTQVLGPQGNSSTRVGGPVAVGGRVRTTADTTLVADDASDLIVSTDGALIVRQNSIPEKEWVYAAASGGISNTTTAVTMVSAGSGVLRNYVTSCQISDDTLGAATELAIRDGAGGAVLWRQKLQTASISPTPVVFATPLKGTAATLTEVVTLTATVTGGVYVNCQGYQAP